MLFQSKLVLLDNLDSLDLILKVVFLFLSFLVITAPGLHKQLKKKNIVEANFI